MEYITLNNQVTMPILGLGTYRLKGKSGIETNEKNYNDDACRHLVVVSIRTKGRDQVSRHPCGWNRSENEGKVVEEGFQG